MKSNYDLALKEVLKSEGGYTNDPHDPGGPTNFGITIYDYRKYINKNGNANDVKNMTVDQAGVIYKARYWDAINGDKLPSGVDYCLFDYGVNSGISRALRVYVNYKTIDAICDERLRFLKGLKTWPYFRKGWTTRVEHVRAVSKQLEGQHEAPVLVEKPWPTIQKTSWTQRLKSFLRIS